MPPSTAQLEVVIIVALEQLDGAETVPPSFHSSIWWVGPHQAMNNFTCYLYSVELTMREEARLLRLVSKSAMEQTVALTRQMEQTVALTRQMELALTVKSDVTRDEGRTYYQSDSHS